MTATYTFDVFCTVDGFGSYDEAGDWGGFWGKQGPEFLDRRLAQYSEGQRMVLGAGTFRMFTELLGSISDSELGPINGRMKQLPTTVLSTTLEEPLDWPDATLVRGDAVDVVARLKKESEVPLRLAWQLVGEPGAHGRRAGRPRAGHDLPGHQWPDRHGPGVRRCGRLRPRSVESRTLDGRIQELIYRPNLH